MVIYRRTVNQTPSLVAKPQRHAPSRAQRHKPFARPARESEGPAAQRWEGEGRSPQQPAPFIAGLRTTTNPKIDRGERVPLRPLFDELHAAIARFTTAKLNRA